MGTESSEQKKLAKLARKKAYEERVAKEELELRASPNYADFIAFKYALESHEYDSLELAGFEFRSKRNIGKGHGLYAEDQLLLDVRSKSGFYALIHADKPRYVKENKTDKKDYAVNAFDMLNRYIELKSFMMEKSNMYYQTIFNNLLKNNSNIIDVYNEEKKYFPKDKELTLYWLIIFGLLEDDKFNEVAESISNFDWNMAIGAIEYFKRKEYLNMKNSKEKMDFLLSFKN